jgi:3',5'-cyclic AMP phosphodiesterase CpdA
MGKAAGREGKKGGGPFARARGAAAAAAVMAIAAGCATGPRGATALPPVGFPQLRLAVLSDLHLFDTGTSGPGSAFDQGLGTGIKLLDESQAILAAVLPRVRAENPDIVLVCGDLTRDGERSAHLLAARELEALEGGAGGEAGPRVYVVPGNHDVANPRAALFAGPTAVPVPSVSPEEFAGIYGGLGYGEAFSRDPSSLSYAVMPAPGLVLIAIDSCRYEDNGLAPVSRGRVRPATLAWVEEVLGQARRGGTAVVAFMHHGVAEHFQGQKLWEAGRVAANADRLVKVLLQGGARIVFTGHGHAQDSAWAGAGGQRLLDVETGSLVSWPDPWRIVNLGPGGRLEISTRYTADSPGVREGFAGYSLGRARAGVEGVIGAGLRWSGAGAADASILARQAALVVTQFYGGDERTGAVVLDRGGLGPWGRQLAGLLEGPLERMGNDREPADNNLAIDVFEQGLPGQ